jgi:hypothetical protein
MAIDPKKNRQLKEVRQRRYLGRDFDSLRATLLDYARQYYPNQIQDFSEASVGGLFLDMAAYVGDNLSFYLDHLYGELNYETAVETDSIQRALINAGIPVNGASPATVELTLYIEVSVENPGDKDPKISLLPIIKSGTTFNAVGGVTFTLVEDVEFIYSPNKDGNYILNPNVEKIIGKVRPADGKVLTYILSLKGIAASGQQKTETISIGTFQPFRTISLIESNVTEIVKVFDDYGNNYYEVGALSHDVVYRNIANTSSDKTLVKDSLRVIPAPFRFTKTTALANRKTTLTFGGGNANTLEDDVIPDPSDFAISFPYSRTISRIPVNPEKLLTTRTLGVAAADTQLTIIYRYGGGLSHNVAPGTIGSILSLSIEFPKNPPTTDQAKVRNTLDVTNFDRASGGEDALTVEELVSLIPTVKNSQERIVTKEDLLARVYTMPSNFGRVFRAAISPNSNNPLSTQLHIISRSPDQKLIQSSDTLKSNIRKYLNAYRMISDSIDVLDAKVINLQLKFTVVIDPALNRNTVLSSILLKLQDQFLVKNMHINQPIIMSDVVNNIFTVAGVIAVDKVEFLNISGNVNNRQYSDETYDVKSNSRRQIIFPPVGGIFEVRYPEVDIIAKVVS